MPYVKAEKRTLKYHIKSIKEAIATPRGWKLKGNVRFKAGLDSELGFSLLAGKSGVQALRTWNANFDGVALISCWLMLLTMRGQTGALWGTLKNYQP